MKRYLATSLWVISIYIEESLNLQNISQVMSETLLMALIPI